MITVTEKGSFSNTEKWLNQLKTADLFRVLNRYGNQGVVALSNATPVDSGLTAESWYYSIVVRKGYYSIRWHNRHQEDGIPIAVLIQYGHGTGTGGYVQGRDYIMPAIRPVFDRIVEEAMREVSKV
jgi:hypothetical protein